MLVALAATLAIAPVPDVAFIARFYYPPSDRRISKTGVYVCDLRGKHRRLIAQTEADAFQLLWLSNTQLAWIGSDDKPSLSVYDFTSKRRTTLRTAQEVRRLRIGSRGASRVQVDRYLNDSKLEQALRQRLAKEPPEYASSEAGDGFAYSNRSQKVRVWDDGKSALKDEEGISTPGVSAMLYRLWPTGDRKRDFGFWANHSASGGSEEFLGIVDWRSGAIKKVAWNFDKIDFLPTSRHWAALDPHRPLSPYGKDRHVWTSRAFVGTVDGKHWPITTGLVFTTAIAVRPNCD